MTKLAIINAEIIAGSKVMPARLFLEDNKAALGLGVLYSATWLCAFLVGMSVEKSLLLGALIPLFISVSLQDFASLTISDKSNLILFGLGIIWQVYTDISHFWQGMAASFLILVSLWLLSEAYFRLRRLDGLGLGDVKFIGAASLLLGPVLIWPALVFASIGGIVFFLVRRLRDHPDPDSGVPFAPFLSYSFFLIVALFI